MFDGAAAATADVTRAPDPAPDPFTAMSFELPARATPAGSASGSAPARELLVIDSAVPDAALLAASVRDGVDVFVLQPGADAIGRIAALVADRKGDLDAIHVMSHGSVGRITLGGQPLDTAALSGFQAELAAIGAALSADGDLLLYGCDVGDGSQGALFLRALAGATGADVAASADATGARILGGDWTLESGTGAIETLPVLRADAPDWAHLMAAAPSVALSVPTADVLLGETFRITATYDNVGTSPGYGPYLDLFIPARGADGGSTPDGLSITGARYLGRTLALTERVLSEADIAAGTVAHPYARDTSGSDRVAIPGGYAAGDRLVVVELPFAGYTSGQPAIVIDLDARVSPLADPGRSLQVSARAGMRWGEDPLDNPSTDPTLLGATATASITPAVYRLITTYIGPENETASGPNYVRAYRIDVDVADGQSLSNIDLSAVLDPGMQFSPLAGIPSAVGGVSIGASPTGAWTNVDGVLVSAAASGAAAPAVPGGTVNRVVGQVTGTAAAADLSMVVGFHVAQFDARGARVIDASSGDARTLTLGTAVTANWTPADPRDARIAVGSADPRAHQLDARAVALQKLREIELDTRGAGLGPGDILRYTLDAQVSDYFAFGTSPNARPVWVVDDLSDGLELADTTNGVSADPVLTVVRSGGPAERYTLVRDTNYAIDVLADGRSRVIFRLNSVLPGTGQVLIGDLFAGDAVRSGATTLQLVYRARVLDAYRVAPPDASGEPRVPGGQPGLNESDPLVNVVFIKGSLMDATLDPQAPGLQFEHEYSRSAIELARGAVTIDVTGRNGTTVVNDVLDPVCVAPGDTVSYTIDYLVPTGDFEGLRLSAFLPLPVFDVTDPRGDGSGRGFTLASGPYTATPGAGTYSVRITGGDGTPVPAPSVVAAVDSNGVVFDFGDRDDAADRPLRVTVSFTVGAGSVPLADDLRLSVQARADSRTTARDPVTSQSVDVICAAEPSLEIFKGVVQDDVLRATSIWDPAYSPGDPRSLVRPSLDGAPLAITGTIGDTRSRALDTDVREVDAGDTLRFAIVVQNLGESYRGAFDVTVRDELPAGVDSASLANLRIAYGDGRVLYDGTSATLSRLTRADGTALGSPADALAALFGASGLRLVDDVGADRIAGTADDRGAIGGTEDASDRPSPVGSNVVIVTYDARLLPAVETGATLVSSATLTNYASRDGGRDFTAVDPTDPASIRTVLPEVDKRLVATSEPDAITAGTDVVIGERLVYEVVVAVPEGTTPGARFVDTLTPGLSLVSVDSIVASPGLSFSGGAPDPARAVVSSVAGDADRLTLAFGTIVNTDTDNATRQTLTIRYTAVADNVAGSVQGEFQRNLATFASASTTVTDAAPDVRIVEPALSVSLVPSVQRPAAGDTVAFTVTITPAAGRPPAQDVSLDIANRVPAGLAYLPGSLVQLAGPSAGGLGFGGDGVTGTWASLAPGQSVVLRFEARVGDASAFGDAFDQTATVRWSSLPGAANGDLSPLASVGDFERTGRPTDPGGTLNAYRAVDGASVSSAGPAPVLSLVASSEPGSSGSTVVPGEVLRYRMVVQLPEGVVPGVELRPVLPAGLRFVNDGTVTVGFVADGAGIDSSTLAGTRIDLVGGGADASAIASLRPVQVLPGSAIVDAGGTPIAPGTVMPAGAAPRLLLGDLTVADRDANREFVVIEFDAIVDNAAGNVAGLSNPVVFDWRAGGADAGRSNTVVVGVAEPSIVDLDKRVVEVNGTQVTFEATFSNSGTQTAYDLRLLDSFTGSTELAFGGSATVAGLPAGATNASVGDALDVRLPSLAPGQSATIRYVATILDPAVPVAARDAVITYTSLSPVGESLPVVTGDGPVATITTGERTGSPASYGGPVNTYRDTDAEGLAVLRGTLWDDTRTTDSVIGFDEARLRGVPVTLTAAGADGRFGTADDRVRTTTTDDQGRYAFIGVPAGEVRIVAPSTIANANGTLGEVRASTDIQGSPTDATIALAVTAGRSYTGLDIGYLQRNDAPVLTVPGPLSVPEDGSVAVPGLRITDPDAGPTGVVSITLSVGSGRLELVPATGVAASGAGSGTVTVFGTVDDLNATLATLVYRGNPDFAGADVLLVRVDDRGNTGDADGDRVPNERVDDALSASATVAIRVLQVNEPPRANPDANRVAADDPNRPRGNVIGGGAPTDRADTDPDGDPLALVGVRPGGDTTTPAIGSVGNTVTGRFGSVVVGSDGRYTYTLDRTRPDVLALRPGDTLVDVFTYTIRDPAGLQSTSTLTLTIDGVNDAPLASSVTTTIETPGTGGPATPTALAPPTVTDADDPRSALTVTVDTIDRPQAGLFLRPDGTPLAPGQTLTVDQLQRLTYQPDPAFNAAPVADGTVPAGGLAFTVRDPAGASSSARIDVSLRPSGAVPTGPTASGSLPPAPPVGPTADSSTGFLNAGDGGVPPVASSIVFVAPANDGPRVVAGVRQDDAGFVAPLSSSAAIQAPYVLGPLAAPLDLGVVPGAIVAPMVAEVRNATLADRARLDNDSRQLDLDADGLFPSNRVGGFFGEEVIGSQRELKAADGARPTALSNAGAAGGPDATAAAPTAAIAAGAATAPRTGVAARTVAADDDCAPVPVKPKVKPKPVPVKRLLPDEMQRPTGTFSEQIDVQKKKFKPPVKAVPKPPPVRQC